jgi:hypothetical protein
MGLIRKQVGFDLKVKVESWISEYLGSFFEYSIDDNYRIRVERSKDSWYVISRLVRREVEIPDYISFAFKKKIEGTLWDMNIKKMVDLLNKYPHLFHNLNHLTFTNYTPWSGLGEKVEILKIDGEFAII